MVGTENRRRSDQAHDELLPSGERIIPGMCDPDLLNEHLVRYLYAREYSGNKHVLDTGCGVGYGCFRLAESARSVVGIDNDAEALRYARIYYALPNINYVRGDCHKLPFASDSFDLITSFELVEHLSHADNYLSELQRVLKQDGLLVISTPNRPVYAEHRGGQPNPFHVREYDPDEFVSLLMRYFPWVRALGQTHVPAVGIFAIPTQEKGISVMGGTSVLETAAYLLCACSQRPQKLALSMVFVPAATNVLLERERHIQIISAELAERRSYLTRLQSEFDEKAAWANRLDADLAATQARIQALNAELAASQAQIQTLNWLLQRATSRKRKLLYTLAPLDWLVGFLLTLAELFGRSIRRFRPLVPPSFPPPDTTRCSIVVLSWQGKHLLAESLPALLTAVTQHGGDNEIIVVDNGSSDGTVEFVRQNFPTVRLIQSPRNLYFSRGNNLGVSAATRDIVVLLNNDMIVAPDFLKPLLTPFRDPNVFGVASQVFFDKTAARREETGKTRGHFDGAEMLLSHEGIVSPEEERGTLPVFWIGGGAGSFDRRKYLWLGGFDTLFDPFYVEDVDLSYRAWKAGWHCGLAAQSRVVHKHRASSLRFGKDYVENTTRRNHYLFFWKSVSDLGKTWAHCRHMARRRFNRAGVPGVGIRFELRAYLRALRKLPSAMRRRVDLIRRSVRTDDEVLEALQRPPDDLITSSKIDFREGSFEEYLGEGWHGLEEDPSGKFRWTNRRAVTLLRTPVTGLVNLTLEGYVPSLERYETPNVILTVRVASNSQDFHLEEGVFEHTSYAIRLPSNSVQKIELSVSRCVRGTADDRPLGIIVRRLEFAASLEEPRKDSGGAIQAFPAEGAVAARARRARRILFISAFAPIPNSHAGGQRVLRMIQGLSRNHNVSLLTFIDEEKEKGLLSTVTACCQSVTAIPRQRLRTSGDPWGVKPSWLETEYGSPEMRELVAEAASSGRYDLLQFEYLQMCQFLPRRSSVPTLLTHLEVQAIAISRKMRNLPRFSSQRIKAAWHWMQILHYELTRLPRFNQVIVLTEEEAEYLRRYLPNLPVVVHHLGVDCAYFQPSFSEEEPNSLVFVGFFKHEPNLDAAYWLIDRIFPRVLTRFPNARLYLVGNEPPPELKECANGSNILVTGWVPDIRPYLSRATVFVAPLRLGAGMRGKVLEAWAMARPVVCSSIACAGERGRHEGNLLVADDEEAFVQSIIRLFEDEQLRRRLGQGGLDTVRAHYDWELLIQEHNAIYERMQR